MATRSSAAPTAAAQTPPIERRVEGLDWARIGAELDEFGAARTGPLLTPAECARLATSYADDRLFRSRVVMARHGYGQGEYRYFAYPLPPLVAAMRQALYPWLALVAGRWEQALGRDTALPRRLDDYLALCHEAGQTRPTPLLLKYEAGDYNCLHRDLYGDLVFPLQATFLLSRPMDANGEGDFSGGEFLLTEQRPRMQSRAEVVSLGQGEGVIFAVNQRPRQGARGVHRVQMRHGVSRLHAGKRFTLGVIFHDAR